MKTTSLIILAFILACGCTDEIHKAKQDNPLFSTSRATTLNKLNKIIDLETMGIHHPTKVIKKDTLLVVLDQNGLNKISIYHEDGRRLGSYLPTGVGASEGLYFLTMALDSNNIVTAYDFGNNKMVELDLRQLGQPGFRPTFTSIPATPKHLCVAKHGPLMVSTGMFEEKKYSLTSDGREEYFLDHLELPAYTGINDTLKNILFMSNIIRVKPDGTKIVCANMQSGILDLCAISPYHTLVRTIAINHNSPWVTLKQGRRKPVAYSVDNLFGFCDIEVTNKYIYALYSGRSYRKYKDQLNYGERIIVFDWEGKHVRTYLLGVPFASISFCEEENAIYGLTNHPNTALVKYVLD